MKSLVSANIATPLDELDPLEIRVFDLLHRCMVVGNHCLK